MLLFNAGVWFIDWMSEYQLSKKDAFNLLWRFAGRSSFAATKCSDVSQGWRTVLIFEGDAEGGGTPDGSDVLMWVAFPSERSVALTK